MGTERPLPLLVCFASNRIRLLRKSTRSHSRPRTLYSLRHTYATLELYKGRNIHQLARQMGSSVAMLEKHYNKLTPMLMANEFAGERREAEDASWG